MNYVIFDLDNCISDDRWRWALVDHSVPDLDERYAQYNALCDQDAPIKQNIDLLNVIVNQNVIPVVLTARPDCERERTWRWLRHNLPFFVDEKHVLMRGAADKEVSPVLKPRLLREWIDRQPFPPKIVAIFDDREDVLEAYRAQGWNAVKMTPPGPGGEAEDAHESEDAHEAPGNTADAILTRMASTYKKRNAIYGSNYKMVAPLVKALFPNGVPPELVVQHHWHIFELVLVKLSRFAVSDLTHLDSIHDAGVYCAMIEAIILETVTENLEKIDNFALEALGKIDSSYKEKA